MRIENINPTSFESNIQKTRFITKNMYRDIEFLLYKMNSKTKSVQKDDYYIATIITKLSTKDKNVFEDERRIKKVLPQGDQLQGFSVLKIGNVQLDIDNENGEIIDFVKPYYKPWFLVLKKAEKLLSYLRDNFDNDESVKKETLNLRTLTQEGTKKINKLILQFEKQRLEDLTKELEMEISK